MTRGIISVSRTLIVQPVLLHMENFRETQNRSATTSQVCY